MIMNILYELQNEIERFWEWSQIDILEYGNKGMPNNMEEYEYPGWSNLINLT